MKTRKERLPGGWLGEERGGDGGRVEREEVKQTAYGGIRQTAEPLSSHEPPLRHRHRISRVVTQRKYEKCRSSLLQVVCVVRGGKAKIAGQKHKIKTKVGKVFFFLFLPLPLLRRATRRLARFLSQPLATSSKSPFDSFHSLKGGGWVVPQ